MKVDNKMLHAFCKNYRANVEETQTRNPYIQAAWNDYYGSSTVEKAFKTEYSTVYRLSIDERNLEHLIKCDREWREMRELARQHPTVRAAFDHLMTTYYMCKPAYDPSNS